MVERVKILLVVDHEINYIYIGWEHNSLKLPSRLKTFKSTRGMVVILKNKIYMHKQMLYVVLRHKMKQ